MRSANDIRKTFLDFFASKGHTVVASSPLVPALQVTAVIGGTGASGLRKTGGGLLWLSGNNTYSGQTIITAGELVIDHPHALASCFGSLAALDWFAARWRRSLVHMRELGTVIRERCPERVWELHANL